MYDSAVCIFGTLQIDDIFQIPPEKTILGVGLIGARHNPNHQYLLWDGPI